MAKLAQANRKQRKIKRLMEMTKDDWKVTMLKLQKRRPPQTKTLLEMQSEHFQKTAQSEGSFKFVNTGSSRNMRTKSAIIRTSDSLKDRLDMFYSGVNNSNQVFTPTVISNPSQQLWAIQPAVPAFCGSTGNLQLSENTTSKGQRMKTASGSRN